MILLFQSSTLSLPSPVLGLLLGIVYLGGMWLLGISRQDRLIVDLLISRGKGFLEKG
jgi:hypothetical protein